MNPVRQAAIKGAMMPATIRQRCLLSLQWAMAVVFLLAGFTAAMGGLAHCQSGESPKSPPPKTEGQTPAAAESPDSFAAYRKMVRDTTAELREYDQLIKNEEEAARKTPTDGWAPSTAAGYLEKTLIGLVPSALMLMAVLGVLIFSRKGADLLASLQSFRVGPVEIVRAAIDEIKSEFIEGERPLKLSINSGANRPEQLAFSDFARYPTRMETRHFGDLLFHLDRNSGAYRRLLVLESRLALQEDRLRSSTHFDDNEPPWKFAEAKAKLFTLYLSVGNIYGFAQLASTEQDSPIVDVESAEYYFTKAIGLRDHRHESLSDTVGYAHFCIAAVKGICGRYANQQTDQTIAYIKSALNELEEAEKAGHAPSYQYHLKAVLLMSISPPQPQEAAQAWQKAAELYDPPSWKMYFNSACALASLKLYHQSLNELEKAISTYNEHRFADDGNPRELATHSPEGDELKPFWPYGNNPDWRAQRARSESGLSFEQILSRA